MRAYNYFNTEISGGCEGGGHKIILDFMGLPLHTILELPLQRDRSAWNVPFALHTHKLFQCFFLALDLNNLKYVKAYSQDD